MKLSIGHVVAVCMGMTVLPAMAQPSSLLSPVPKLTGKECVRDLCLGDELGKFNPGMFQHTMRHIRLDATTLKQADVLKEMRPLYQKAGDRTLDLISREIYVRGVSGVSTIPLNPEIHEALLSDQVRVCGFMELVTAVEGRSPEKWDVTFRAMPGQFVQGRQAWVITEIKAEIPGVFSAADVQKLRRDLSSRAKPVAFSQVIDGTSEIYLKMGWIPLHSPGSTSDAKGMPAPKARVVYGCDGNGKLPSL